MELPEILRRIRALDLLSDLGPDDASALLERCRVVRWSAGRVLFREGDFGDSMLVVLDGTVRLTTRGSDGVEVEIANLGQGEVLGEMAVIDPGTRAATATATTEAHVLVIGKDTLDTLIRDEPELAGPILRPILRILARRFRATDDRVEQVFDARLHVHARAFWPPWQGD